LNSAASSSNKATSNPAPITYQRFGRDADATRELALGEEQRPRKQP
jgi:hypothetical protein